MRKLSAAQARVLRILSTAHLAVTARTEGFKTHTLRSLRDQGYVRFWPRDGVSASYDCVITAEGREVYETHCHAPGGARPNQRRGSIGDFAK